MSEGTIRRVFVANRGEIAVRIVRACQSLGIESVVGHSAADRDSLAVKMADRAVCIGPPAASASYLKVDTLIAAALGTGCQAVHPGYGFLSERSQFARACAEAGLIFIGPSAEAIDRMGDKINAIAEAKRVGVPVVPGRERLDSAAELVEAAAEMGYPCLLKATAGGGGRGMRVVRNESEAASAYASAQAEALAAFGNGTLYLEKYIEEARHIEIQVLADHHGNVCHLYERDCSVQRRHQKLIEESPSPALDSKTRAEMATAALALARAVQYRNAGTVEFVYDVRARRFYFLEMNTRVQVEHPVTEAVTGIDIVREQIQVAAGQPLSFSQADVRLSGHAIECRINAEDAWKDFRPSPGTVTRWDPKPCTGLRLDTHVFEGYRVPPYYDSMVAKAVAHAPTRAAAIEKMDSFLASFDVAGIATTIPFQRKVIGHPRFANGTVTTTWVEKELMPELGPQTTEQLTT
jgi:acetyl-CoA carboxylase, biotin carboxylase subunit